jgi:Penicillin amidase
MFKYLCSLCAVLCFPLDSFSQIDPAIIDIVRDSFGVPHIFAKTDAEVAYGLAWAHCEDDFETLQTCFLASKGLLGQVKGKEGAAVDYVVQYISYKYQLSTIYQRKTLSMAECLDALRYTKRYLMKHYGRLDVPLGAYQKMVRGKKVLPLAGLPDVIAAIYSKPYKKGRVQGIVGDCLIQLVRFTPEGPVIESVNTFGASNRPESKHYSDQMEMFLEHKTKPMSLNKKTVYQKAERIYHPGF